MATTRHTQPKVTTRGPQAQVRDGHRRQPRRVPAALYKELKPAKTYAIAVGQVGLETPAGRYTIQNKAINPAWHVPNSAWAGKLAGKVIPGGDPTNPIKARWLGIFDGVGIHGTSDDASIGRNASHGCIRMHIPDVEELYDEVPVGAAGLHRLGRRAGTRRRSRRSGPPPSPRSRSRAWWSECRSTSVPMKTPRSRLRRTAYHMRRGVARALDALPRARRRPVRADGARLDELALGGDLTRGGVDEEQPHGRGG